MKQIAVLSGKGGTGKTSLVAAFAALAEGALFADCDVDAADLHLLLRPEIEAREPFESGRTLRWNKAACLFCGRCIKVCRFAALTVDPSGPAIALAPFACEGCGCCVDVCPGEALTLTPKQAGELYVSTTRFGPFVHARLGVAEEASGQLVTKVRRRAQAIAEEQGRAFVLIDGCPGTGCPVIASITGTDLVVLVTEPTVSGLHDLRRVVEVVRHFRRPCGVVINKADLNGDMTARIKAYCRDEALPFFGEIPFDTQMVVAQLAGCAIVETSPSAAGDAIRRIWSDIAQRVTEDAPATDVQRGN
ncbi:(4Fe-4S)-binding protein [Heliobacterium gestii]|uniref:(4Fe-4S)-binding protein n=1 Tax=Heliomicrobium gestii TaxID=2699 RepID=A0A845LET4_HELGE|nr:ATP-binding protein [Heliomicrobium gestii]MBM7866249.1 MinD superfamily P-loop ATPase [Heliomicrobium gestii]MZP42955.1 (4Fe-4S)-binding protein [Heliomicrobium gestii]